MSALAGLVVLLLAATVVVELARFVRNARRAVRINRALHELRRPLQAVALALEAERHDLRSAEVCLEQARCALADLDLAINGRRPAPARVRVALSELTAGLEDRWRAAGVRVDQPVCGDALDADPGRLGAALDNLVANALRHGTRPVSVRALTAPGVARFEVRDGGPAATPAPAERDPRHGHGLRVAAGIAASHGGALIPPRRGPAGETVAAISLPTAAVPPVRDRGRD